MRLIDRLMMRGSTEQVRSMGPWSWPSQGMTFDGIGYGPHELLHQTAKGGKTEAIPNDFGGYLHALRQSPPAFAAQMKRARYLSQARFQWRNRTTGKTFGTTGLGLLERPWPSGTTGELLTKMEWHEGLAGNAYVFHRQAAGQLKVLRPDWVTIVLGSEQDGEDAADQLDAEVIGFVYAPGGLGRAKPSSITTLLPQDVAHWSPLPDPAAAFRGMSWITPLVREIQGDIATADHKLRFFENGATPNLVVKGIPAQNGDEFRRLVKLMEDEHAGVTNAYKTLYLAGGADATVVGSNLKDVAFKDVQGAGETRIAAVGEVPASLLGISEGMQGSSLNAGNYKEARRSFIDGWFASTLQSAAACLAHIIPAPSDGELTLDPSAMPLLREDEKDAADILSRRMLTIESGVRAGFKSESVVAAVDAGDLSLLEHTGLFSVQLQPPGTKITDPPKESDDSAA